MCRVDFFTGALLMFSTLSSSLAQTNNLFVCADAIDAHVAGAAKVAARPQVKSRGHMSVLVIFARFNDEAPGVDRAPGYAVDIFDSKRPGSFAHFYRTMSFGQLEIHGTVLPRRYSSDRPASAYISQTPKMRGLYGEFVQEILQKVDADVDLGLFDNDGPDGIPNSSDDDGRVDYLFINLLSVPRGFLLDGATGIAGLGIPKFRSARAKTPKGKAVYIHGMRYFSAILQEGRFAQTVGTMAHEFGHSLGLPDLYDTSFQQVAGQQPSKDSAGIGRWGLMGWGAHGWSGNDGPAPLCAWSRERLGWIGRDNERLVEVSGDTLDMRIADLHRSGFVYKVPLWSEEGADAQEYLLLEQRTSTSHSYNRSQPAAGLLVWHIRPRAGNNAQEENKLVDLICADGLYRDAGYPLGEIADPQRGGDNLDFWAHDAAYRTTHEGNLGDATDLFDGVHFTRLSLHSHPDLVIDIQRQGAEMMVSLSHPSLAGIVSSFPNYTAVLTDLTAEPIVFQLLPNYPNPFNPETTIRYILPELSQVRLVVYNVLGQAVRTLVDGPQPAGTRTVVWDGRDQDRQEVASGLYLYRLEVVGKYAETRQMSLVR